MDVTAPSNLLLAMRGPSLFVSALQRSLQEAVRLPERQHLRAGITNPPVHLHITQRIAPLAAPRRQSSGSDSKERRRLLFRQPSRQTRACRLLPPSRVCSGKGPHVRLRVVDPIPLLYKGQRIAPEVTPHSQGSRLDPKKGGSLFCRPIALLHFSPRNCQQLSPTRPFRF